MTVTSQRLTSGAGVATLGAILAEATGPAVLGTEATLAAVARAARATRSATVFLLALEEATERLVEIGRASCRERVCNGV